MQGLTVAEKKKEVGQLAGGALGKALGPVDDFFK